MNFWYHEQTKHSYVSVRSNPSRLSWENQPSTYKVYPSHFPKMSLDLSKKEDSFLYYIAGLTAKKSYPGVEYFLRINPSAGALYPNELYFQARGVEGVEDGIYHYEVSSNSIVLLQSITDDGGLEPYFGFQRAMKGYLFLISALYFRSSWKYKNRAFRYCLLDAGHLLGSIEASALHEFHAVQTLYSIDREKLNTLFGFGDREWFLCSASMAIPIQGSHVEPLEFALEYVDATRTFEPNPLVERAYKESALLQNCKKEGRAPHFTYQSQKLKETIFARRSQRGFDGGALTKGQFDYIMEVLLSPIMSDCDEDISIYAVINRVIDLPLGLYKDGVYIKYGDFKEHAGYLCLEQYTLASKGAVVFFLTSKGENYQPLYQKAGMIGHRLYVVSNYLGIGCSGIGAYYDDEVADFLGCNEMVLYALAIGK